MKPKNPVPESPEGWLVEIAAAYQDAREAIPFGPAVGESDPVKAADNLRKHGVPFAEAASVFLDASALTFSDPDLLQRREPRDHHRHVREATRLVCGTHCAKRSTPGNQRANSYAPGAEAV